MLILTSESYVTQWLCAWFQSSHKVRTVSPVFVLENTVETAKGVLIERFTNQHVAIERDKPAQKESEHERQEENTDEPDESWDGPAKMFTAPTERKAQERCRA